MIWNDPLCNAIWQLPLPETKYPERVLLLSCHQIAFFHLPTDFLAFSLNFRRSSKVSNGNCNISLVVSGA